MDWFGAEVSTTDALQLRQSDELVENVARIINSYSPLKLAALERIVLRTKSIFIALALMEDRISVSDAVIAARLEVIQQINRWGEVEDAHDVDREELTRQLAASRCVLL